MNSTFQQRTPPVFSMPKSMVAQQHGQKPTPRSALPSTPRRSFQPRPGHF
jgi:hypothetical protein